MDPTFFPTAEAFHTWLAEHHATATEILIGFYKTSAAETGITYAEALDVALCYGWIDGVRKSRDAASYTIRCTPRKRGSFWSRVNTHRVEELIAEGRMQPAGLRAFAARDAAKTAQYSYEREISRLEGEYAAEFQASAPAWTFFQAQPASYQRAASWWVLSAKQEATRRKRLATLIATSAEGRRLPHLLSPGRRPANPPRPDQGPLVTS